MNTDMRNPFWDKFIEQEYRNYKAFINSYNMPLYKTNYINGDTLTVPYTMQVNTSCNPMILNINTVYMANNRYLHCQPSLFHEFTHMLDSEYLFVDKKSIDRSKFLSLYTEYHASQIDFSDLWNMIL